MADSGRKLKIDWNSVTLVGVRTRGFTVSADYVDVTTDDANGWKTLLSDPGVRSVEVKVGGITENQILLAELMAASVAAKALTVQLPTTTGTLTGSFLLSGYEETGEHDGAAEFSATFMSSGAITYTAGTVD